MVVSPPSYEKPKQTAPLLIPSEAFPDLREIIQAHVGQAVEFGGAVLSEDNGVPIKVKFYIDYGQADPNGAPFQEAVGAPDIPPGTLADGPRRFQGKQWRPRETGCHSVTMMVSHDWDYRLCPQSIEDSSYLVWRFAVCGKDEATCSPSCAPLMCAPQCPTCATPTGDAGGGGGP